MCESKLFDVVLMGSLILDVLRKGIWSSFCGGWYYDPSSATFTNTFHLYLFLFFLCFPFSVYVYLPRNALNWFIYTSVVGCVFLVIKLINLSLHRMFDSSECIIEELSPVNTQTDCDKRKSMQKAETREDEGIELQVLNRDKNDCHTNENAYSYEPVEFADFNASSVKDEVQVSSKSGTIDLKVDVHRKNSSDSNEESKLDQVSMEEEVNRQNISKEKLNEHRGHEITSSDEVLLGRDSNVNSNKKRLTGHEDNVSHDVSAAVDSIENSGSRLSERSRQYSVSVTLGEGSGDTGTISDPIPARSMQLTSEYESDTNNTPGLVYWKEKTNSRSYRPRVDGMLQTDLPGRSNSNVRRSSSPLSVYACEVRPIAEQSEEHIVSSVNRSSVASDNGEEDSDRDSEANDEDYEDRKGDDEDVYGDIEDLDVEQDSSHSPLLSEKHEMIADGKDLTSNLVSFSRKKYYVDSLTRKYKRASKRVSRTTESLISARSEPQSNSDLELKMEDKNLGQNSFSESVYNEDQIAAIFSWLFCNPKTDSEDSDLVKKKEYAMKVEYFNESESLNSEMKNTKDFSQSLQTSKSRLRFSSAPTLTTTSHERSHNYPRQRERSGTCSELEIGLSLPDEKNKSLSETIVQQSTSLVVYPSTEDSKLEHNCVRAGESNEASSSGSNTELSSLLPISCSAPLNSVQMHKGHRNAVKYNSRNCRNNRNRRTSRRRTSHSFPSSSSIFREGSNDFPHSIKDAREFINDSGPNTHIATSYDDTTEGAVHLFQDENGQWLSYTFDERSNGIAVNIGSSVSRRKDSLLNPIEEHHKNTNGVNICADSCTTFVNSNLRSNCLEVTTTVAALPSSSNNNSAPSQASDSVEQAAAAASSTPHSQLYQIHENDNGTYSFETVENPTLLSIPYNQMFANNVYPTLRFNPLARLHLSDRGPSNLPAELNIDYGLPNLPNMPRATFDCILDHLVVLEDEKQKRRYYKFRIFPFSHIKVYFDRLSLDALLDYNETYTETCICIILAVLVSCLGAVLLHYRYYHDIPAFIFCFVMATSHYSLLKSVQPDASSPVHGFNKIVAYSRPVYFICCSSFIVGLKMLLGTDVRWYSFCIYQINFDLRMSVRNMHDFLCTFILFFPVFFTLGMFPQINTFLMYVFEQLDMHIFGGSAVTSLKAASYCIFRSILAVLLLFGFAYGGLNEPKSSQHILFSIFISLLVIFAYNLSRCTCDPTPIWNILVKQLWPIDEPNKVSIEARRRHEKRIRANKKIKKKTSPSYVKDDRFEQNSDTKINRFSSEHDGQRVLETKKKTVSEDEAENADDPLPEYLQKTFNARLQSDLIASFIFGVLIFAMHRSTIFSALQPELEPVMHCVTCSVGFLLHYIMPQLRKQLPWLCIARPVLRSIEHEQFEAQAPATVTWFEKVYIYLGFVEKNVIYPVMFIGCLTKEAPALAQNIGPLICSLILTICSLKCLRLTFSHTSSQYMILAFSVLFFRSEYSSKTFVIDYFLISILYYKIYDLLLKIQFVLTYIAPWQITWGSAFHAFAQPFSLPHSAMMFAQAALSAFLSSPLYPFLGSAIFLTSYPRPIKFWERDYNTRRVDHSNTKMASHLERNLGADDNNLNSIFYEHLTRSLQRSLCGDLLMGRWGEVSAGDCFILASDYLNCLIHIVELGNGLVTFQMRGLEFRGTYCQQREVEAIRDGVEENDGCCCCKPGHLPFMLSVNAAFSLRWLAWEVTTGKYILEGYSISDNSAASMLQVFDFRKMLISYYVKSIIYYAITNQKLEEWINSSSIREALQPIKDKNFVDLDPVFNMNIDEDYDYRYSGVTRNSFCAIYLNWIRYCNSRREKPVSDTNKDSPLVTLCFALSLLGRRTLGTASHNTAASVEFFLYGVHTLFKGDFRIASIRDEWVFTDMELLRRVVAPAIRMSLKLHQDHFMAPDEYECSPALFAAISSHQENLVISHEGDPVWRKAVLSGMPSLLALRRVMDEGSDDYKIIMLNKRYLSFRVIKMNRECVRGLWAGQQQELIYLRNLNPERGSIQNAKQALRNIINSSCDQPIGYPIFVSPLTTSYVESNAQYTSHLGGPVSIKSLKDFIFSFCRRVRKRCVEGCSSGSSAHSQDDGFGHDGIYSMTTFNIHSSNIGSHQSMETSLTGTGGTITRVSAGSITNRTTTASAGPSKPGLVTLAGFLSPPGNALPEIIKMPERKLTEKEEDDKEPVLHRVKIIDPSQVHDGINQGRLIDVIWPDEIMRQRGGRNFWKDWVPEIGMEGQVIHRWIPNHPNPNKRSTFDRTILLVKIEDKYVPISESGVQDLGAEV